MATKKKTKAAGKKAKAVATPPDPREPLAPKPANLNAVLKAVKAVLADIPEPDPIIEEPEPEEQPVEAAAGDGARAALVPFVVVEGEARYEGDLRAFAPLDQGVGFGPIGLLGMQIFGPLLDESGLHLVDELFPKR